MTYRCQRCGALLLSERDLQKHVCSGTSQRRVKCPTCDGRGRILTGFIDTGDCPNCKGSGEITVEN